MKRFSIVLALTVALCLAFVGSAYANFGPHGGYVNDTDACAGCHRAHSSFSTVGWKDQLGTQHASALLVGNAQTMTEFCNACHGALAPGASTNVASGIFDSGPSAGNTVVAPASSGTVAVNGTYPGDGGAVATQYNTDSTFGAPLNGGGFTRMPDPYAWQGETGPGAGTVTFVASTSAHRMDVVGPLWGSGNAVSSFGGSSGMTCTDCHDPHGSSNYRLLKAKPNPSNPAIVGGYAPDGETPNPFVFSDERGYPIPAVSITNPGGGVVTPGNPTGGWLKHQAGANQMALYRPNYTDTTGTPILHTVRPNPVTSVNEAVSMSVWCASCHMNYNPSSAGVATNYNYDPYLPGSGTPGGAATSAIGTQAYHRHAIDITMAAGLGAGRALAEQVVGAPAWVPLENAPTGASTSSDPTNGYIGCLTCHRAHGSSATMAGWSNAHLVLGPTGYYMPVQDSVAGVDPNKGAFNNLNNQGTSDLLRANNRGVCERCHNK